MTNRYDDLIRQATTRHLPISYDWRMYKAQLIRESNLNPNAVSPVGAKGIAQFMPETWIEESVKTNFNGVSVFDPEAAIFTGANFLNRMIDEWYFPRPTIDRYCLGMASYNAGIGNILSAQTLGGNPSSYSDIVESLPLVTGEHSKETISYVQMILVTFAELVTDRPLSKKRFDMRN